MNTPKTTSPDFIVGAYASLPFDRRDQETYYSLLAEQNWINGLEIPFPGDLTESLPWLSRQIADHWDSSTITAIPGTMVNVGKNPKFGLASADEDGRAAALEFTDRICTAVQELASRTSRSAIKYVQLHSAPTRGPTRMPSHVVSTRSPRGIGPARASSSSIATHLARIMNPKRASSS